MSKLGKVTNISITVWLKDGTVLGTPWFTKSETAKNYMKRKLKRIGATTKDIKKIEKHEWHEGDTLRKVHARASKRLRKL